MSINLPFLGEIIILEKQSPNGNSEQQFIEIGSIPVIKNTFSIGSDNTNLVIIKNHDNNKILEPVIIDNDSKMEDGADKEEEKIKEEQEEKEIKEEEQKEEDIFKKHIKIKVYTSKGEVEKCYLIDNVANGSVEIGFIKNYFNQLEIELKPKTIFSICNHHFYFSTTTTTFNRDFIHPFIFVNKLIIATPKKITPPTPTSSKKSTTTIVKKTPTPIKKIIPTPPPQIIGCEEADSEEEVEQSEEESEEESEVEEEEAPRPNRYSNNNISLKRKSIDQQYQEYHQHQQQQTMAPKQKKIFIKSPQQTSSSKKAKTQLIQKTTTTTVTTKSVLQERPTRMTRNSLLDYGKFNRGNESSSSKRHSII